MTKARNIADLGSNDVLDTTASGVSVTGAIDASGNITSDSSTTPNFLLKVSGTEKGYIRNTSDITEINGVNGVSLRDSGTTVLTTDSTNGVEITSTGGQQLKLSRTGTGTQISSLVFNDASDNQNRFNSSDGNLEIEYGASNTNAMKIGNNGDITMYKDDGTTAGVTFDASSGNLTVVGDILVDNNMDSTIFLGKGAEGVDGVTKIKSVQTGADSDQLGIAFYTHPSTSGSSVAEEAMRLEANGNMTHLRGATFNEGGGDFDFRIESNNNANMFVVDGGNDRIGFGTNSPSKTYDFRNGDVTIFGGEDGFNANGERARLYIGNNNANLGAIFGTGIYIDPGNSAGDAVIIRQATGRVGLGVSNPDERLHINGRIKFSDSSFTIQTRDTYSGADAGINTQVFGRFDERDPEPYADSVEGMCRFGFTSWNLNDTNPYADSFIMNSYTDASGGDPNMFLVHKSGSGVKVARQGYSSSSNFKNGTIYTLDYTSASDERVKENVQEITGGLESILALRPVTFEWTDDYIREGHSKNANENEYTQAEGEAPVVTIPEIKTTNVGFIAQEVEEVIPTVVHQDNVRLSSMAEGDYLKDISYEKLVPHLVSAIKEQQIIIDDLKSRIEVLEAE